MGARNSRINPGPICIPLNAYEHGRLVNNLYSVKPDQQTDIHYGEFITVRLRFCRRDGQIYIKLSFNGPVQLDKLTTFKEGSALQISMIHSNRNTNWDTEYIKWHNNLSSIRLNYNYRE